MQDLETCDVFKVKESARTVKVPITQNAESKENEVAEVFEDQKNDEDFNFEMPEFLKNMGGKSKEASFQATQAPEN